MNIYTMAVHIYIYIVLICIYIIIKFTWNSLRIVDILVSVARLVMISNCKRKGQGDIPVSTCT